MPFNIRPFAKKDAQKVAALHRTALPRGFLSSLGDAFLGRLYGLMASSDRAVVLVGVDERDDCVGFISGSPDVGRCYKDVLRRGAGPLLLSALPALTSPKVALRIIQTLAYPMQKSADRPKTEQASGLPKAELLSIAVDERTRGGGLGKRLVVALEQEFVMSGHDGPYRVVTDASDPRSNAFYEALGFERFDTFRHHEHQMARYVKTPDSSAPNDSEGQCP